MLDPVLTQALADCGAMPNYQDRQHRARELAIEASRRLLTFIEEATRLSREYPSISSGLNHQLRWSGSIEMAIKGFERRFTQAMNLPQIYSLLETALPPAACAVLPNAVRESGVAPGVSEAGDLAPGNAANTSFNQSAIWGAVLAWCEMEALGNVSNPDAPEQAATQLYDALRLREPFADALRRLGLPGEDCWRVAARVRIALAHSVWVPRTPANFLPSMSWLHDPDVAWLIGVHEYQGARYFAKASFEELLWWMSLRPLLDISEETKEETKVDEKSVHAIEMELNSRMQAAQQAGYRVEILLDYD
jgi:hypothetical protein